jgi:hypothetical protein
MRRKSSVWTFLLMIFLAIGTAVAILPGCSDDNDAAFFPIDSDSP